MTHFVREDTAADHQAAIDAKSDALWGACPERVIEEAGGAESLLIEYMATLDGDWLAKRLEAACERLVGKGDL